MQSEVLTTRYNGDQSCDKQDCVALEQPLEILINGESFAVTMRTPGDDFALTAGFLYAESIISSSWDIGAMGYWGQPGDPAWQNVLNVTLRPGLLTDPARARLARNVVTSSACGVCGKASLDAAQCLAAPLTDDDLSVTPAIIRALSEQLRARQQTFDRTGGLHAAGLYDAAGGLLSVREDVGRHNALDKLIGNEVQYNRVPLDRHLLLVSGRASFEILQKAAMARIPVVCAVSAPSSLAVQLARDLNITLIGFLRGDTFNVYSAPRRVRS